jgi:histidine triad (HIT) family protein
LKSIISSLLTIEAAKHTALLLELIEMIREVAAEVVTSQGACRVLTNPAIIRTKHLHRHVSAGGTVNKKSDGL